MSSFEAEHILNVLDAIDARLAAGETIAAALDECVACLLEGFGCERAFLWFFYPVERGGLTPPLSHAREGSAPFDLGQLRAEPEMEALVAKARDTGQVVSAATGSLDPGSALAKRSIDSLLLGVVEPELGPGWVMAVQGSSAPPELAARLLVRIGARMADVVGRHMTVAQLERAEQRVHELVVSSKVAVLVIDLGTQRLIEVSDRAESLLGWPQGQLLGVELAQLHPQEQPGGGRSEDEIAERLARVSVGASESFMWTFCRADGGVIVCEVEMSRVPNSERLLVHASLTPKS